jgi:formamidopyrimidine-DNA glycosylase
MPELPEVETTVRSLNRLVGGLKIVDVWSNYNSPFHKAKRNIKNPRYFREFKKQIVGKKILAAKRRAKNILINLQSGQTILVHMKMSGHFLYGVFKQTAAGWTADKLIRKNDPFSRFIRLLFKLSNGKHLAFSDLRKFAKVFALPTKSIASHPDIKKLGPEPLAKNFSFKKFIDCLLKKPNGKIKQVLMSQEIISGIGNIYSDEILWSAGIHPLSKVGKTPRPPLQKAWAATKTILKKSISLSGDSASDFRGINGRKGGFQNCHRAYRETGKKCRKKGCAGVIAKIKLGGRSAHFCPVHQKYYD